MEDSLLSTISPASSLADMQEYIRKMVVQRGFGDEKPLDLMLLMVEEVGELAKALRKQVGLKVDREKSEDYTEARHEMADVLIYLLALANECGVDLFAAFKEKEEKNAKRFWERKTQ